MYAEEWRSIPDTIFHDWPRWNGETSIRELAERIIREHRITNGDEVIGSSLGGIVACEIANQVPIRRLTLVGSAICKEEINALLASLHPLVDLLPVEMVRISAQKLPHELSAMFAKSEPEFIRNMTKAIFDWNGLKSDVPLLRIHGLSDLVIPLPETVIDPIDGGHLIAMTNAKECIGRIAENKALDSIGAGSADPDRVS